MRFYQISRDRLYDLLMLVEHDVDDEIHPDLARGFLQILPERIRIEIAGMAARIDHFAVVRLNRLARRNAGHDRLRTAGIAREIVVFDIAEANPAIGFGDRARDVDRRSRAGFAHVNAIAPIGIHAADFAIRALTDELLFFLLSVRAVTAQRKHERNILRTAARSIQLIQKRRKNAVRRHRTRYIAGDNRDFFTRTHDFGKSRRSDRVVQRANNLFFIHKSLRNLVCHQHAHQVFLGQFDGLNARSESKFKLHAFSSCGNAFAAWRSAFTTGSSSPVRKRISAPPPVQI